MKGWSGVSPRGPSKASSITWGVNLLTSNGIAVLPRTCFSMRLNSQMTYSFLPRSSSDLVEPFEVLSWHESSIAHWSGSDFRVSAQFVGRLRSRSLHLGTYEEHYLSCSLAANRGFWMFLSIKEQCELLSRPSSFDAY